MYTGQQALQPSLEENRPTASTGKDRFKGTCNNYSIETIFLTLYTYIMVYKHETSVAKHNYEFLLLSSAQKNILGHTSKGPRLLRRSRDAASRWSWRASASDQTDHRIPSGRWARREPRACRMPTAYVRSSARSRALQQSCRGRYDGWIRNRKFFR